MDELKQRLMERAHLSPEQAEQAVGVVADFLREHATGDQLQGLASRIPGLGAHAEQIPGDAGSRAADMLGGLFKRSE